MSAKYIAAQINLSAKG